MEQPHLNRVLYLCIIITIVPIIIDTIINNTTVITLIITSTTIGIACLLGLFMKSFSDRDKPNALPDNLKVTGPGQPDVLE